MTLDCNDVSWPKEIDAYDIFRVYLQRSALTSLLHTQPPQKVYGYIEKADTVVG